MSHAQKWDAHFFFGASADEHLMRVSAKTTTHVSTIPNELTILYESGFFKTPNGFHVWLSSSAKLSRKATRVNMGENSNDNYILYM